LNIEPSCPPVISLFYKHLFRSHLFQESMLSSPRYQMAAEAVIALAALLIMAICCHIMFHFVCTPGLIIATVAGLLLQTLIFLDALTNVLCLEVVFYVFPFKILPYFNTLFSLKQCIMYDWLFLQCSKGSFIILPFCIFCLPLTFSLRPCQLCDWLFPRVKCVMLLNITLNWYFRNALGVIAATIPSLLVYISFSCDLVASSSWHDRFFCFCIVVALLQYCNYSMLRSFAKTIMAILVGSVLIILLFVNLCSFTGSDFETSPQPSVGSLFNVSYNLTSAVPSVNNSLMSDHLFSGQNPLRFEIILSTVLLLLLVSILNYEFENSYRLSFNASVKAQLDKQNMQLNKDQADWLLHNIIPAHLAELFKTNRSYSRNHQDVGVIFATIVNFNEFYDEMYAGGREYLRVLNELVSDYEVMLSEPRFKDVEKIKTISSTFMAASGLNEESRAKNKHPYAHLFALMEFAMELQVVVARFNESIFNFNFVLNIGYNYGPVTAGVIGTTKLLYDIWGDAVNIASRMYSTGEDNRIQVPQATADLLSEMFEFSYRDEIAVKGKGVMKTYLLERKKPGAHWE
ncbi:unnamed protein product, partial [Candidula unifasciata]